MATDEDTSILVHVSSHVVSDDRGRRYSVTVRGAPRPDGTWEGFLRFESGASVLTTAAETEQSNVEAVEYWAAGLSAVYLEGAFGRARDQLDRQSSRRSSESSAST